MQNNYKYSIQIPNLESLGYLIAIANTDDKHDRSAPTHYHWKILKCRMLIFSNSSILACPDKLDIKRVHIVFNKRGDDYDKIISLFLKFSLAQEGAIQGVGAAVLQSCLEYTLRARLAPLWNVLGHDYLVYSRDFLTTHGPQDGLYYHIWTNDNGAVLEVKPMKINLVQTDEVFQPGEWIRVLPSLNKAIVEEYYESMPESGNFRSYKDLRRHWKNIHGYRLPEAECAYYAVRFWRGEPLTYPETCVLRSFPIITPVPTPTEKAVLCKFLSALKSRMSHFLGMPLKIQSSEEHVPYEVRSALPLPLPLPLPDTQAITLCTPTQNH